MPVPLNTFKRSSQTWSDDACWGFCFLSTGKTKEAWKTGLKQSRAWLSAYTASCGHGPLWNASQLHFSDEILILPRQGCVLFVFDTQCLAQCLVQSHRQCEHFNVINTVLGEKSWQNTLKFIVHRFWFFFFFWCFRHLLNLCFFRKKSRKVKCVWFPLIDSNETCT